MSSLLTEMMMCGIFPSCAMTFSRSTVSEFPTTSSRYTGRYFSTLRGGGLRQSNELQNPDGHEPWYLVRFRVDVARRDRHRSLALSVGGRRRCGCHVPAIVFRGVSHAQTTVNGSMYLHDGLNASRDAERVHDSRISIAQRFRTCSFMFIFLLPCQNPLLARD